MKKDNERPGGLSSCGSNPSVSTVPSSIPDANGPDLWNAILSRMPSGSVIAGGAVRDYLLGVEPKDIDVFMGTHAGPCEEPSEPANLYDIQPASDPRFGLFRIDNEHERFEEYAAVSRIACVSSGTMFGFKVDAVIIEDFAGGPDLIQEFDFNITRCWFDGEIHDTPEAKRDRDGHCVTLVSDEREARSIARFERLNARWGGGWVLRRDTQAIEARRAATTGAVHESAVRQDAPNTEPENQP
jgi:hypothetical protein